MPNPSTYFKGNFSSLAPQACIILSSGPTFSGISSLVAQANGSLRASWSAGSTSNLPIVYRVFIQAGTATGLFTNANRICSILGTTLDIFEDGTGTALVNGTVYYVGVRAVDASGITDTNVVTLNATSSGVATDSETNLLNQILTKIGTPAGASLAADLAEIEAETDGIALIPTNPLLTTDARLNALDATISSRLASSSYVAPDNTDVLAIKAKTDNLPADPASNTQVNTRLAASSYVAPDNTDIAAIKVQTDKMQFDGSNNIKADAVVTIDDSNILAIKAKTDNLPADPASNTQVNTRLASSGYTAPDNASIAAIKAQTDKFLFDASNFVKANAQVVADKTGYDLLTSTVNNIAAAVWNSVAASFTTAGSFGSIVQTPSLTSSQVAAAVWNALLTTYNTAGSFGANAQNPPLNSNQIASAVWNALIASYNTSGTFGNTLQNPAISPTQVAQAVWNAIRGTYATSGTFGEALQGVLSAARAAKIDNLDATVSSRASEANLDADFGSMSALVASLTSETTAITTAAAAVTAGAAALSGQVDMIGNIVTGGAGGFEATADQPASFDACLPSPPDSFEAVAIEELS